jgi:hypothetical protein
MPPLDSLLQAKFAESTSPRKAFFIDPDRNFPAPIAHYVGEN